MVGQTKLLNKLNMISLETLPKSLLLLGAFGCGKHTYATLLAKQVNLPIKDISSCLNLDTINSMYLSPQPIIYLIDNEAITIKEEGMLLKILEEPTENIFIVILAESKNYVLDTILNRCQIWEFSPYSEEELKVFSQDNTILSIAKTPGEIQLYLNQPLEEELNFCNIILDYARTANFASVLEASDKINFKDESEKYEYYSVINLLDYCAINKFKSGEIPYEVFILTHKLLINSKIKNINKKHLFENYLCNLKLLGV